MNCLPFFSYHSFYLYLYTLDFSTFVEQKKGINKILNILRAKQKKICGFSLFNKRELATLQNLRDVYI